MLRIPQHVLRCCHVRDCSAPRSAPSLANPSRAPVSPGPRFRPSARGAPPASEGRRRARGRPWPETHTLITQGVAVLAPRARGMPRAGVLRASPLHLTLNAEPDFSASCATVGPLFEGVRVGGAQEEPPRAGFQFAHTLIEGVPETVIADKRPGDPVLTSPEKETVTVI